MSDHDRKKLWGQAAARCSMCRKQLVATAAHAADADALIGEEAHIISASAIGPRHGDAVPGMDFDGYYNRILLCRNHHRVVDEHPHTYPVDKLRKMRSQHERWVRERLYVIPLQASGLPFGLRPARPGAGMALPRLRTGKDAWQAAAGAIFYLLESLDEDEGSPERRDAADGFLDLLKDYAEAHHEISMGGANALRAAQGDLRKTLDELADHGLVAFGTQRDMLLPAARDGASTRCTMAVVVVRPCHSSKEGEELHVVVSAFA